MAAQIEIKPIQKSLAKAILTFIERFVAFANTHKAYFDYLANKYTEDDLFIDHIDLQNLDHIDNVVEIITLHQGEVKENKHDKTLYPAEMYAALTVWGKEANEIRMYILQKHIESNLEEIKSEKKLIADYTNKLGKHAKDPKFQRLVGERKRFIRELEEDNVVFNLEITTLKIALMAFK